MGRTRMKIFPQGENAAQWGLTTGGVGVTAPKGGGKFILFIKCRTWTEAQQEEDKLLAVKPNQRTTMSKICKAPLATCLECSQCRRTMSVANQIQTSLVFEPGRSKTNKEIAPADRGTLLCALAAHSMWENDRTMANIDSRRSLVWPWFPFYQRLGSHAFIQALALVILGALSSKMLIRLAVSEWPLSIAGVSLEHRNSWPWWS